MRPPGTPRLGTACGFSVNGEKWLVETNTPLTKKSISATSFEVPGSAVIVTTVFVMTVPLLLAVSPPRTGGVWSVVENLKDAGSTSPSPLKSKACWACTRYVALSDSGYVGEKTTTVKVL